MRSSPSASPRPPPPSPWRCRCRARRQILVFLAILPLPPGCRGSRRLGGHAMSRTAYPSLWRRSACTSGRWCWRHLRQRDARKRCSRATSSSSLPRLDLDHRAAPSSALTRPRPDMSSPIPSAAAPAAGAVAEPEQARRAALRAAQQGSSSSSHVARVGVEHLAASWLTRLGRRPLAPARRRVFLERTAGRFGQMRCATAWRTQGTDSKGLARRSSGRAVKKLPPARHRGVARMVTSPRCCATSSPSTRMARSGSEHRLPAPSTAAITPAPGTPSAASSAAVADQAHGARHADGAGRFRVAGRPCLQPSAAAADVHAQLPRSSCRPRPTSAPANGGHAGRGVHLEQEGLAVARASIIRSARPQPRQPSVR